MTLIGSFHWSRGHSAIEVAQVWVGTDHGNGCATYAYTIPLSTQQEYKIKLIYINDDHKYIKYVYASKNTQTKFQTQILNVIKVFKKSTWRNESILERGYFWHTWLKMDLCNSNTCFVNEKPYYRSSRVCREFILGSIKGLHVALNTYMQLKELNWPMYIT